LGHTDGLSCLLPCQAFNNDFTIIDSDGIHEVALDYCGCHLALPKTIQLLRARLFPSTTIDPKTAATFRVLETFQMLSFTSKVSGYEYYSSLARRTDNTGTVSIPVCVLSDDYRLPHASYRIVTMPL
jgi:CxC2 like cysteine cluster associated with KDZ transposases